MYISKIYKKEINYEHLINKISVDSRTVENGDVFVAISGMINDGNDYIKEAIKNGAKTIVTEQNCYYPEVNIIIVENARKELGRILKIKNNKIMKKVKIIGVTGTNGKTTTTTLVHKYLKELNIDSALIGSNGVYYGNKYLEGINTTPDITIIYDIINDAYNLNCRYIILEVSSHAIKQLRIFGIEFDIVLFTNLTLDHLDYHNDFTDYKYTKGLLMASVNENNYVILNRDSEYFHFYENMIKAKVVSYGTNNSIFLIKDVNLKDHETEFKIIFKNNEISIKSNLLGLFNVYNICSLVAIITALKLFDADKLNTFLQRKIIIPGRMEEINYKERKIIVDFAHTPDGVFGVLSFLKTLKRKIILVVGCGGSRDKTKRRVVGEIAVSNSNYVIFTSDNPRDEEEMDIINDIIRDIERTNYEVIVDRKDAIKKAIAISDEGDIIAILGRGNEQFQKVKGKLIPLNDIHVVQDIIKEG
jgi:UDP-N-acetylmuramoyl-L-alanyl-D-glutamate--2,6-diaminopimelate ligase